MPYIPEHLSIQERVDRNVDKSSGCWLWTLSLRNGYGQISIEGKTKTVTRVYWEEINGLIPEEMCVLHTCDTPSCVNLEHLFLGTQADNIHDMDNKGRGRRRFSGVTHCKLGHSFSLTLSGKRVCRVCHCQREKDRYYRRKQCQ